jgi:hypothetical protein
VGSLPVVVVDLMVTAFDVDDEDLALVVRCLHKRPDLLIVQFLPAPRDFLDRVPGCAMAPTSAPMIARPPGLWTRRSIC